jgi:hypothetical protein
MTWVVTFAALSALLGQSPALAPTFDTPNTIVLVDSHHQYAVPAATPHAAAARSYKDYTLFRSDLNAGAIPATVSVVIYDPEAWPQTPLAQQLDPGYYERRFVRLARNHGLRSILAPGLNLPHPETNATDVANAYAGTNLAGTYSIQTQRYQRFPWRYANELDRSAAAARAIHPRLNVLSGLSTGLAQGYATGDQLNAATLHVRTPIQGFWMNIAAADPLAVGYAADFLGNRDPNKPL